MRFEGVIVSDDLEMQAIAKRWRTGPAAALALQAGCDLLLVCHSADAQAEAHEAVIKAVEEGTLAHLALEDAAARVRRLKERFASGGAGPDRKAARLFASSRAQHALAEEIAERGGTRA
jgi:beta-N-acetylhexosaminidase